MNRITEQRRRVATLRAELEREQNLLDAMLEILGSDKLKSKSRSVRRESIADRALRVLADAGRPMHVDDILQRLDGDSTKPTVVACLSRHLGAHVRRTGPNEFACLVDPQPEDTSTVAQIERKRGIRE